MIRKLGWIFFLMVLTTSRAAAGGGANWLCDMPSPDAAFNLPNRQAVWDAINAGLLMSPKDLKLKFVDMIYTDATKTAGYYVMISKPANQRWVFIYPELEPPDQKMGIHDFCRVWIFDLP